MGTPKKDYEDKLEGALHEIVSAMSCLNMPPRPAEPKTQFLDKERGFLVDRDYWAYHCQEHLGNAVQLLTDGICDNNSLKNSLKIWKENE